MEVLEQPIADTEAPEGAAGEHEPETNDAPLAISEEPGLGAGGYATKFARRQRSGRASAGSHAGKSRRESEAARRRNRAMTLGLKILVPVLLFFGLLRLFGIGAADHVALPPAFEPAAFAGVLDLSSTERVGTLFQATLRAAPEPARDADFRSRVDAVAVRLNDAGYESLLILGPDGTTLASGAIEEIVFAAPGAAGT